MGLIKPKPQPSRRISCQTPKARRRAEANCGAMKAKKRQIEEDDDEESSEGEEGGVVGQIPTISIPRHIKKRSLKNKALTVSFDEKNLRDFVTGFHKRKKKRRKEAERQLKEKERLKRIEQRKRRKEERELALYGGTLEHPSAPELGHDEPGSDGRGDELRGNAILSETKVYESGGTVITVVTSQLRPEGEDVRPIHPIRERGGTSEKKTQGLHLRKKPLKRWRKTQKKSGKAASGKKDGRKIARR